MEDLRKLFMDEASDLLVKLEDSLLLLENDTNNKELVNEIFRVMHSLKGSGGMFGFNNLTKFTHSLENLYDNIRNGKIVINENIITFTINASDLIKNFLLNDNDEETLKLSYDYEKQINDYINKVEVNEPIQQKKQVKKVSNQARKKSISKVYYISFIPDKDILKDGTNPLYLIDELIDLGEAIVYADHSKIPDINTINAEECYTSWVVILRTSVDVSDIKDVFIFVENNSKISIKLLSERDIFDTPNARSTFSYLLKNNPYEIDSFVHIAESLADSLNPDEVDILLEPDEITSVAPNLVSNGKTQLETSEKQEADIIPKLSVAKTNETLQIDTVKVSSEKLDTLINLVSELVTTQARLHNIASKINMTEIISLSEDFQVLARQFRDASFEMRLIPVSNMLVRFRRLIRDLSKSLNKKVDFITEGIDIELDKSVLTTISDPLMHIIRNAIDHGIETPEDRIRNNKPEVGKIKFKATNSGTSVQLIVEDDGAGIDKEIVRNKAIEKGLISKDNQLTDEEILNLLLLPGFSTSNEISDISGRGVGMDVVKSKVDDLRGEIFINSEKGKGTKFTIRLPLTLSIIDGLLININSIKYIIPLTDINRIYKIEDNDLNKIAKGLIEIEEKYLPVLNLVNEFGGDIDNKDILHAITILHKDKKIALLINNIISEYQAVLKPVNKLMNNRGIFAGATILGDGNVALVIDINKLVDYYSKQKQM